MANTRIGEVGITWQGKEYILRPSFYRLNQIEDIEHCLQVAAECVWLTERNITPNYMQLVTCVSVLNELADEPLPEKLTGHVIPSIAKGGLKWKLGEMTLFAIAKITYGILKHGMFGKPSRDRIELAKLNQNPGEEKPDDKFDLLKFVGMAMAPNGLGKSSSDAWAMTMIEFQAVIDMQFPISEKDRKRIPPPAEVMDKSLEKVDAANIHMKKKPKRRAQKLGAR